VGKIIRKGTRVLWEWGNGTAYEEVAEIHRERVTHELDGAEVTRNGSDDNPAYLIEQEDGDKVLKLRSEIEIARD